MSLKQSVILPLIMCIVSSIAAASTSIECRGGGKYLKIVFDQAQSGRTQAIAEFGDSDGVYGLPQNMTVDVIVSPAGSFYSDKEVRSYDGHYIADDLMVGFSVSQVFDANGEMVLQLKNVFGVNQKSIGTCQVTQGDW